MPLSPLQVNSMPVNMLPVMYPGQGHAHTLHSSDDLPKSVVVNLNQGSAVKSMDFHPVRPILLLGKLLLFILFLHLESMKSKFSCLKLSLMCFLLYILCSVNFSWNEYWRYHNLGSRWEGETCLSKL
jgi:hypothetical protein